MFLENKKSIHKGSLGNSQNSSLPKRNSTGLPHMLEESIESLSGISLKDVKVHLNSVMPAGLDGNSDTQDEDIHVAPRQE